MDLQGKTILTGIKPTGTLHIGNYAGALKPAVELGHQVNRQGKIPLRTCKVCIS